MNYSYVIILCFALFLVYIFYKNYSLNMEQPTKINISTRPIITYYKSGGIVGYDVRLEIYSNSTYKLFSHDKLVKIDKLDLTTSKAITEILNNYYVLEQIPKSNIDGNDYLYHNIDINGHYYSLDSFGQDENVYNQIVSQNKNLFDSIKQIDLLADIQK